MAQFRDLRTNDVITVFGPNETHYDAQPGFERYEPDEAPQVLGVDMLKGPALTAALEAAELPTSGTAAEKRHRLTDPVDPATQEK